MEDKIKIKEPIRILNIVPNMRAAGIETFIMNVYRNIDRDKVQFDFLVHNQRKEFFDDEIRKLGGKIYRLTLKDDKNFIKYIKDLKMFFKTHTEYKIVHGHMQSMMPLYLYIAKKNNVPVRIAHSHNGNYEKTFKGFLLHIFSRFSKKYSTVNWACSKVAGKYLFKNDKFDIIYNGIDIKKFEYNDNAKENKVKELNLNNKKVLLHVGRFELQKNHEFLIDLYEQYYRINENSILLLVGEGKLEPKIRKIVENKGLENNVKFLGVRDDVNEIMQVADIFVLPSLYEGLPVVGIEAQYSGLPCIFSDKITQELEIINNVKFLPIGSKNISKWLKAIEESYEMKEINYIDKEKFDIKCISNYIMKEYVRLYYGK